MKRHSKSKTSKKSKRVVTKKGHSRNSLKQRSIAKSKSRNVSRKPLKGRSKRPLKKQSKPSSTKRRVPRGYKPLINKHKRPLPRPKPKRYTRVKVRSQHQALTEIDKTLTNFETKFEKEFGFSWSSRLHQNKDGSVDGTTTVLGMGGFKDWDRFFGRLSSFKWPSGMWFSLDIIFDVPDGRKWRVLEKKYERYKGAWSAPTFWRHSTNAASMLAAFSRALMKRLIQRKYGYKPKQIKFRLTWNEENEKPNWR